MKKLIGLFVIILIIFIAYLFLKPLPEVSYLNLQPITDNAFAISEINKLNTTDNTEIRQECQSILLNHGYKTQKVAVLLHGYSECPQQFRKFAQEIYDKGFNVYVPRAPFHGLNDRLTNKLADFSASDYTKYAEQSVQIAHGLGQDVYVMGLSGGGILTSWIAINDASVSKAIIISPAYNAQAIPGSLSKMVINLFGLIPNQFVWWDANKKEAIQPDHQYPWYSTKSMSQVLTLGRNTSEKLRAGNILAKNVVFVFNPNDDSIDLTLYKDVITSAKALKPDSVDIYEYPLTPVLKHDLIDPEEPGANTDNSYPALVKLIAE